jgi:hypothetical protein
MPLPSASSDKGTIKRRNSAWRRLTAGLEQVTEAAHRDDLDVAAFEFFAHPVHVDLDRGVAQVAAKMRQVILELGFADHAAMPLQQHFKHGEFARRQFQRPVAIEDAAIHPRQAQTAQGDFGARDHAMCAAAAQHRADARFELGRLERFGKIVVRAAVEPLQAVVEFVACAQDDHRCVAIVLAQARQQGHAVDAGQAQVKDDQVVAILRERLLGKNAIMHHVDHEAALF